MESARGYLDLQGRRATVYFLWRRALAEYQLSGTGTEFLAAIEEVTKELRDVRIEAQEVCEGMAEGQAIARRIEALEELHLREMVQFQQAKVQGLESSLAAVQAVEEQISDLMLELQPEVAS